MPDKIRLTLLGRFDARTADARSLDLAGRKVQALIGYLAVEADRPHTREQLAALLWAETGDERARHNLRQQLAQIRRQHASLIAVEGDLLSLDRDLCETDVDGIERLLDSPDLADLRRGVESYRGELLEGLVTREAAFDDWLHDTRQRLRTLVGSALERLAADAASCSRCEEAIDLLRRRLTIDPACEEAHLGLMRMLAETGRRSEALRQYQLCVETLERQLGAEPGADTVAVYDSIRSAGATPLGHRAVAQAVGEAATSGPQPPSIAVLPFDNLAADGSTYFSDGVTEDIITALGRFSSLTVIARASSFVHRGGEASLARIAEELGVQYIARGSIRRGEQRVRINVELIEAASGKCLWSQRFDGEIEDVCLVRDEVTETIVSTLAGRVEAARLERARRMPPERLDAYDFVLRAKDHHRRFTATDSEKALEMLEQALHRDPQYALAHAWMACCLGQAVVFKPERAVELLDQAKIAAERSRQLDDNESESHRVLAQIYLTRHDLARSLSHQERALFLNPNDDRIVVAMGEILGFLGRHQEAVGWVRKAMRLNPYHPDSYWGHLGRALFHLGLDQEARDSFGRITEPRIRELAYRCAVLGRVGPRKELELSLEGLLSADSGFDPESFVASLPLQRPSDRAALVEALRNAGLAE
jgi:TolB-like protein